MRTFGNAFLLLLLAIFGFGFSLAYSISVHEKLAEAQQQIFLLEEKSRNLQSRLQELETEKELLMTQVQGLSSENTNLQKRLEELERERSTLAEQIQTYQNQLEVLERLHPLMTWLTTTASGRVISLLALSGLPFSFGAIYWFQSQRKIIVPFPDSASPRNMWQVWLTLEECHMIAKHRRLRLTSGIENHQK